MKSVERFNLDRTAGLFGTYDDPRLVSYTPRRLRILWLENSPLDCRTWSYYCDMQDAMARLHELCIPRGSNTCVGPRGRREAASFSPDVAIVGPRYSINVATEDETLGFDRPRNARLPLIVLQNKMYTPKGWREIVGVLSAKLKWVHDAGAVAAFTWLTRHREFTSISGVPHHWLPFGVDPGTYSRHAGAFGAQVYDVGFTGASGADKYPLRHAMLMELRKTNVSLFTGTWIQTEIKNVQNNESWKAGTHDDYAAQMAKTKIWLTTNGPEWIVGTRYFEALASGTTLLICNRPPSSGEWHLAYDGLFEDGEHIVLFDTVAEMRNKVLYYLRNENERQRIVRNAHAVVQRLHTWDSRARFVTWVAEEAMRRQANRSAPYYSLPSQDHVVHAGTGSDEHSTHLVGCFAIPSGAGRAGMSSGLREPPRSRNRRKLHRYTVKSCEETCSGTAGFGLQGGGFSTGNAHILGKCLCAVTPISDVPMKWWRKRLPQRECSTVCTLHDPRPCGGPKGIAMYRYGSIAAHPSWPNETGMPSLRRRSMHSGGMPVALHAAAARKKRKKPRTADRA